MVGMVTMIGALALAPWLHPLAFSPLAGWQTGMSGNTRSLYAGSATQVAAPTESAAWIAGNVRYQDDPTADPPNKTLARLPPKAVIVWAVVFNPAQTAQKAIRLDLHKAKRFDCCEAAYVAGGEYELAGSGPGRSYSVIIRIYFGSKPTSALLARAQRALNHLTLPSPR